jgi:hypothetical protein
VRPGGDAALELDDGGPGGPELLDQVVGRRLGLEHVAAGEDVHRSEAVFGPRVDGEVRLGDDDNAADAKRVELVKHDVDDGGLGALRRLHHGRLHGLKAVERFRVAVEQFEQQVSPQCLHSFPPLRSFLAREKLANAIFLNVGPCF